MKQITHWLIFVILLVSCHSPAQPTSDQIYEPFRSAWRVAGGMQIGPPLSEPRWIDDTLVQYFATIKIVAWQMVGLSLSFYRNTGAIRLQQRLLNCHQHLNERHSLSPDRCR